MTKKRAKKTAEVLKPEGEYNVAPGLEHLLVPIDRIQLDPNNTNKHPQAQILQLAGNFAKFGQRQVLVCRKDSNVLEAGEGRILAMRHLGWTHCAAIFCDDDEITAMAFAIADNQIAKGSVIDEAEQARQVEALASLDFRLDILGFSEEQSSALIASLDADAPIIESIDDDEVEVLDGPPPFCSTGDLVFIGPHRLFVGDSLDAMAIERVMAGELADMVWTDPPYGVAYEGGATKRKKIDNDDLSFDDLVAFIRDAATLWPLKPGGVFYVATPSKGELETAFRLGLREAKRQLRQSLGWVKSSPTNGRSDYKWMHENILYGWADGAAHYWCGSRTEVSVFDARRPGRSKAHPTMKPVELVAPMIRNSSRKGEIVFDGFGGSGTTMRAAQKLGRRARLIEKSSGYADAICRSMLKFGLKPVVHRGTASFDWKDPRG